MSGHAEDAIVRHGVLEPNINFIAKPFTAEALLAAVDAALAPPP
jgi:FixJ family two-component response regulator